MEYYDSYLTNLDDLDNQIEIGTLTKENETYLVNNIEVENNRAFHGDLVYIKEGKVVGIKERENTFIVGILHLNTNQKYGFTKRNVPYFKFSALSNKYPNFIVPSKSREKKPLYCVIKLNKWETNNKQPIGQIEHMIGEVGKINNEVDMLIYHTKIYPKKNKTTYTYTKSCDTKMSENIYYNTFSIDPEGCMDVDDAIHYKEHDGKLEIGIHIANVARMIETLDLNVYSTIYLNDRQINMLKDDITYNVCSLGHNTPKKALSLILTYENNILVNHRFKETTVVNCQLSYQEVDKLIEKQTNHPMFSLYNFTKKIKKLESLKATKMVEHYMLLYNKLLAETLYKHNKHTILRTHKLSKKDFLIKDETLLKYLNKINQQAAQYVMNPEDTCHEDLNLQLYTHATSPIRRYVDIINQLNMISYLDNKEFIIEKKLEDVNLFQKKLRKFYNYYKKLNLIFKLSKPETHDAYIISINKLKIKVYIPTLDIEHGFLVLSNKLVDSNKIEMNENMISINDTCFKQYDKIKILVTSLPYEEKFNKKLHIKVLEPSLTIY